MTRCILTTYLDHVYVERLDAEAAKRGITRTALAREIIMLAFTSADDPVVRAEVRTDARAKRKTRLREQAVLQGWSEYRPGIFSRGDEELTERELSNLLGDLS